MVNNATIRASSWTLLHDFIETYVTVNAGPIRGSFNPQNATTFPIYVIPSMNDSSSIAALNATRRDHEISYDIGIFVNDNTKVDSASDELYNALVTYSNTYFEPQGLFLSDITDNSSDALVINGRPYYTKIISVTFKYSEVR